jgi:hypothetical protein
MRQPCQAVHSYMALYGNGVSFTMRPPVASRAKASWHISETSVLGDASLRRAGRASTQKGKHYHRAVRGGMNRGKRSAVERNNREAQENRTEANITSGVPGGKTAMRHENPTAAYSGAL